MKKTIITISAAAVMAVAAVCVFCTVKANENPFLNANVEALARTESGGKKCYNIMVNDPADTAIYCGTYQELPGRGKDNSNCYR